MPYVEIRTENRAILVKQLAHRKGDIDYAVRDEAGERVVRYDNFLGEFLPVNGREPTPEERDAVIAFQQMGARTPRWRGY